jgi:hypothetical protein
MQARVIDTAASVPASEKTTVLLLHTDAPRFAADLPHEIHVIGEMIPGTDRFVSVRILLGIALPVASALDSSSLPPL